MGVLFGEEVVDQAVIRAWHQTEYITVAGEWISVDVVWSIFYSLMFLFFIQIGIFFN